MAAEYNKEELANLKKSDFQPVEKDKKIYDKKFETKPVGYFRDAMTRFAKNRTNLIATIILFTFISLAILVPIISPKPTTGFHTNVTNLPPRVPILENWGFMDGTRFIRHQPVDRSTIDPETGIGLPYAEHENPAIRTYNHDFIDMDTLYNVTETCDFRTDERCYGGEVTMRVTGEVSLITLLSQNIYDFDPTLNPYITLGVPSESDIRSLSVLIDSNEDGNFEKVLTVTDGSGRLPEAIHDFDIFDLVDEDDAFSSRIKVEVTNVAENLNPSLSLEVFDDNTPPTMIDDFVSAGMQIVDDAFLFRRNTTSQYSFNESARPTLEVTIENIQQYNIEEYALMVSLDGGNSFDILDTFTSNGTYYIDVFDAIEIDANIFSSALRLEFLSENLDAKPDISIQKFNTPSILTNYNIESSNYTMTVSNSQSVSFNPNFEPHIDFEILDIIGDSKVNLQLLTNGSNYQTIATFTEAGPQSIPVFDNINRTTTFSSEIRFQVISEDSNGGIMFDYISVFDNREDEPRYHYYGYTLGQWGITSGRVSGTRQRSNGVFAYAYFRYDDYGAAFGERYSRAFSANTYYRIIEENADICGEPQVNPDNPAEWSFNEGCPITRVVGRNSGVPGPDGTEFYTYRLFYNHGFMEGFEETPYFFFGTTSQGQDLFALTWLGLRTSLTLGLVASAINITIGIIYGSISGYYGGKVDLIMERFSEVVGRIPWLVTLSIFMAIFGPGALSLILILIVSGWISVAGVTRTQFYRYKGREYVLASRTLGAKDSRLIFRHILPNGIGTIITASILMIPAVIFTEASLSYLGFGIGHGQSFRLFGLIELSGVSIGVLLSDGQSAMLNRPYLTIFPAIVISILMITFNMFGNALRDAFNPSLRGSE